MAHMPWSRLESSASCQVGGPFLVFLSLSSFMVHKSELAAHWIRREHIYRNHAIPTHCPRCLVTFQSESGLNDHLRELGSTPCRLNTGRTFEGFTKDQERQLRCRKSQGLCEE